MKRMRNFRFSKLIITLVFITLNTSCSLDEQIDVSERTKIALRDAGNQLLLSEGDTSSLILPVKEIEVNKYQLAFNKPLSFEPSLLVKAVQKSFNSAQLSEFYRVEVLQCSDREVAYSYQMSAKKESTIIPCAGRYLPETCYLIQLKFANKVDLYSVKDAIIHIVILLFMLSLIFLIKKKLKPSKTKLNNEFIQKIGSFSFYPEQNKLVKEAEEIALSKKECEILSLFVAHPNQIIKRDELTKRVWEDNGVIVGRSLDTYISKLRKKLKSDNSVKLTNVHGVGYKLEIS
jgi:DNA-binding winged helix-turn-helix (wHTH) protein